ncbi:MAG: hypothetical protein HZB13_18090 [Acidobacteria bacterium]|nr:hypothetical protein [Acidobacteriota bacterium]
MQLTPRHVNWLITTNILTLAALAALLVSGFTTAPAVHKELFAERINIVDANGRTVLAICSKTRIAAPAMDGKTYSAAISPGREHMAGMVFFNDEGDEMGGLLFNSFRRPDGKHAGVGHLSFDRFKDNQVLALQYIENATTVQSGLTLYDRPAQGRFKQSLDLIEEHQTASPDRKKSIEATIAGMRQRGELGFDRVFIGSKDQTAQLVLKDDHGRSRARLVVNRDNTAALEFLDESGRIIARYPGPPHGQN